MKTTNRTVLDLNKVQHGSFYYVNQEGLVVHTKPKSPSVRGQTIVEGELAACHFEYPCETMLERARRLDIVDRWTAVVVFQLTANHTIKYTGKKAISMWYEWRRRMFKKKKYE